LSARKKADVDERNHDSFDPELGSVRSIALDFSMFSSSSFLARHEAASSTGWANVSGAAPNAP
jgi:hypothetical protein